MYIEIFGLSDRGSVRDENQDHFLISSITENEGDIQLVLSTENTLFKKYGAIVAIADGMGGYEGGRLASKTVLDSLSANFFAEERSQIDIHNLEHQILKYIEQANSLLTVLASKDERLSEMGTTLVGMVAHKDKGLVFHIGDSRFYRFSGGFIRSLTQDHTKVAKLEATGAITHKEAENSLEKNILTRALGAKGNHEPDFLEIPLCKGDYFLLCSDGLHGAKGITTNLLKEILSTEDSLKVKANRLIDEAKNRDGSDNITVVLVKLIE